VGAEPGVLLGRELDRALVPVVERGRERDDEHGCAGREREQCETSEPTRAENQLAPRAAVTITIACGAGAVVRAPVVRVELGASASVVDPAGGATASGSVEAGSWGESTGTTPPITRTRKISSSALSEAIVQKRTLESDCLLNPATHPLFVQRRVLP
jgi:hypothetical protein